jgi:hypothetical protein
LLEEHGISRYPIGKDGMMSFKCFERQSVSQEPKIEIESNMDLKLNLTWKGGEKLLNIVSGKNKW